MNWDAISAIGELIGALAVVITLVYLTIQLKQNTSAIKSSTWQAIQDSEHRFDSLLTQDPSLISILLKGSKEGADSFSSDEESYRFFLTCKQLIDLFQTHHYQHELGVIDEEMWQTWYSQLKQDIETNKGFKDVLDQRLPHLRASFRELVESINRANDT